MYVSHRCSIKKLCFWGAKKFVREKIILRGKKEENFFSIDRFSNNFFGENFSIFFVHRRKKNSFERWFTRQINNYFWVNMEMIFLNLRAQYIGLCFYLLCLNIFWGFPENLWFLVLMLCCLILKLSWKNKKI